MQDTKRNIEVCFTPAVYHRFHKDDAIVVAVDILRATSSICAAFINGVNRIYPVGSLEEAQEYKKRGFLVAAERDGIIRDFADFGNSPHNFSPENVGGKDVCYSTTNGTNSITIASKSYQVLVGAYLNISALAKHLITENRDVLILCAAWKDKFNLEDSVFAGALAQKLIDSGKYDTICDSTLGAMDLWSVAKDDLLNYTNKVAQKGRLKKNGLDDCIPYCLTQDLTDIIPIFIDNYLTTTEQVSNNTNLKSA